MEVGADSEQANNNPPGRSAWKSAYDQRKKLVGNVGNNVVMLVNCW